jgi:diguanylate cyclase (GGDEF)-like protein
MDIKNTEEMILEENRKIYDIIIISCAISAFVIALLLYVNKLAGNFFLVDLVVGIVLSIIFILRKRIGTILKINVIVLIGLFLGFVTMYKSGFAGSGIYLFIITNVVSITLFSKKKSRIIIFITIVYMILIMALVRSNILIYVGYDNRINDIGEWYIHTGLYLLSLLVIYVVINGLKKYLFQNIIDLNDSLKKIQTLAYIDKLTNLPNYEKSKIEISDRFKHKSISGTLILFEINKLRKVNSMFSFKYGDELLIKISEICSDLKGEFDIIGRVTGGEFIWWIEDSEENNQDEKIDECFKVIDARLSENGINKCVRFNICYSRFPDDGFTFDECYQKALMAFTYSREDGNSEYSSIIQYDQSLEKKARSEDILLESITKAINDSDFKIFYQEKVDAITNSVVGVEALARWESPLIGKIPPDIFIPIIERNNLSVIFGEMIFKMVLSDIEKLIEKYSEDISVSINISPTHFITKKFSEFILEQIEINNVKPKNIMLEITEEVCIADFSIVEQVISNLKSFGVRTSLDDFGTGYSSLNYFIKLNIDEIKIDKSFVSEIEVSDKAKALVHSIIQLSQIQDIDVVAEGVETEKQIEILLELGCNIMQGYYYSVPSPL